MNLEKLPPKPGVYIFKDKNKRVIYIGKALSLKHRVAGYFQKGAKDKKTKKLVSQIASLDFIPVNSEFEALILEAKLIKQHQPKYNIQLKDNKKYLYITVSKDSPPRFYIVRRPEIQNNIRQWYGPFASRAAAKQVLKTIRRIFPFRSCRVLPASPCLYSHLGLCPAPCVNDVNKHQQNTAQIKRILSGNTNRLIKDLKQKMDRLSKKLQFEKALAIKKQIAALEAATQGWKSVPEESIKTSKVLVNLKNLLIRHQNLDPLVIRKIEGYDVSNLGRSVVVGSMVAFVGGRPEKSLYRKFNIKNFKSWSDRTKICNKNKYERQSDTEGIRQIVHRRLNHPEWIYPQLILVDGGKGQISAAFEALKSRQLTDEIALLGLAKKEEKIIIPRLQRQKITGWKVLKLSPRSPVLQLLQRVRDESHRFAQKYYKTVHKKQTLYYKTT